MIGPDGATASQTLDDRGLPLEIVDPDGVVTRFHWTGDGQLQATVDAFGAATELDYDARGLLRRLTPATGAPTVLTLDPGGRVDAHRAGRRRSGSTGTPPPGGSPVAPNPATSAGRRRSVPTAR